MVADQGVVKALRLEEIEREPLLQARVEVDARKVKQYARLVRDGVDLSPIDVFEVEGRRLIVNGWHRLHAHEQAGKAKITAKVRRGTFQEALEAAAFANAANGLPMAKRDLQRAVKLAVMAGSFERHSEREMVAKLGVPKTTLNRWKREAKRELGMEVEPEERPANLKPREAQPLWNPRTGEVSAKGWPYLTFRDAVEKLTALLDRSEVSDAETRRAVVAAQDEFTPSVAASLRRLGHLLLADAEAIEAAEEASSVVQMDQQEAEPMDF